MTGRIAPDWVAAFKRNQWPGCVGIRIRELRRINNKKFRQAKRENQTLNEYWHKTYLPQAKRDKALRSWKTEQGYFHNWISPVIGGKPMKQISQIHVERIKKNLMKEGRAPGTVRYVLAVIRQIFNQAGLSEQNPTKGVKRPRKDNKRERFLKEEEASRLLAELLKRSQQLHDVSLLALHCGLRFGEIAGLTWADVDMDNGTLLIKDPKSTHNRYAFLTDDTKAIFERLLIEKDSSQPLAGC
jgi:integrase